MSNKYDIGMQIRREVLGDEYVNKSLANATEVTIPFQQLVTEYCWGTVWSRPGLSKEIRSLVNLSMLTALNRPDELMLHVRGALRNGCTKEEIVEVFLQTAIYCGVPAAVESFKIAQKVFDEFQ